MNFLIFGLCLYFFYKNSVKTGKFKRFINRTIPDIIVYLQRIVDENHSTRQRHSSYNSNTSNRMSFDEARQILGVGNKASKDEITSAFKKLMMINHPDKGGSQYIATKIIQAKKTLLGE